MSDNWATYTLSVGSHLNSATWPAFFIVLFLYQRNYSADGATRNKAVITSDRGTKSKYLDKIKLTTFKKNQKAHAVFDLCVYRLLRFVSPVLYCIQKLSFCG